MSKTGIKALLTMAEEGKRAKCPPTNQRLPKLQRVHTVSHHSALTGLKQVSAQMHHVSAEPQKQCTEQEKPDTEGDMSYESVGGMCRRGTSVGTRKYMSGGRGLGDGSDIYINKPS